MRTERRGLCAVQVAAIAVAVMLVAPASYAERLPVYKLAAVKIDRAKSEGLFKRSMGATSKVEETETTLTHRGGNGVVEVDKRSGHMFMGDMSKLWNPKSRGTIPDKIKSQELAEKFLTDNGLRPTPDKGASLKFSHVSETVGNTDAPGGGEKVVLGRQVNYRVEVTTKNPDGTERILPVVGGGGKFQVTLGDRGSVIGYHGGWRETEGVLSEEEVKPQEVAEAEFRKNLGNVTLRNVKAELGYYAAPGFENQTVLAPAWAVSGEVQMGREVMPARVQLIAATNKYPVNVDEPVPPQLKRMPGDKPVARWDQDEVPAPEQNLLGSVLDFLIPPAIAEDVARECGTEWIGASQGLTGSAGNKQGFVDHCRAAGWSVNFDWGDSNAWEADWNADDDYYVDTVDLVFYTGHANQNGWVLNTPNDTFLNYTEIGGGDKYGNTDLEWLIIAACGPLQSTHFTTATTNAFDRWRNIFQGLHVMMGYGAVTYDNTSEGRRFMELTRAGWNVIDAWFRTAQEIQPATNGYGAPNGPTIYVVAMYAHNGDHCARNDHLWGMGSTCADVVGPTQQRYMMWSGT